MPRKMTAAHTELLFGKGKPGLDDSKAEKRDADINIFTMSDALENIRLAISKHPFNWRLVPDPDGWNCGHSLYCKKSINVAGLESGYVTWRKIERSDEFQTEYNRFKDDLDKCIRTLIKEVQDDPDLSDDDASRQVSIYIKVLTTFKDKVGQTGGQNLVTMATAGLWGMHQPSRSLMGNKDAFQSVPPLSAFSESLRKFTYKDLLTVYGEQSLELLMIALGRTLVGERGRKVKEGLIKSNPRIVVLCQGDKRLGKSTFTNWLTKMMAVCGYPFGAVDPNAGKFGWGDICRNGGVADDLGKSDPARILNLPIVKMISGGAENIWSERKGENGMPEKGRGVIWMNANEIDGRIHESDSGVLDRVCLVSLYSSEEMKEKYGKNWQDYRLEDRWDILSKQHGISPDAIMLYLMRLAIDKYLDLTGHIFVDENKTFFQYQRDNDRLEELMDHLKSTQPAKLGSYHIKELVDKVGNLVALAVASVSNQKEFEQYVNYAKKSGFQINILRKLVEIITSEKLLANVGELFDPKSLDDESFLHLQAKYKNGDFSDATWGKKDLEPKYKEMLGSIYAQGQTYWPGKGIWAKQEYESQWKAVRNTMEERITKMRETFPNLEDKLISDGTADYHREIWGDIRKILKIKRG